MNEKILDELLGGLNEHAQEKLLDCLAEENYFEGLEKWGIIPTELKMSILSVLRKKIQDLKGKEE